MPDAGRPVPPSPPLRHNVHRSLTQRFLYTAPDAARQTDWPADGWDCPKTQSRAQRAEYLATARIPYVLLAIPAIPTSSCWSNGVATAFLDRTPMLAICRPMSKKPEP